MRANTNTVKIEVWIWWEIGAEYNDCDRSWIAIKRIHFFVYRTIEIVVIQNCYRGQKNYYCYCPRRWHVLERFCPSYLRNRNVTLFLLCIFVLNSDCLTVPLLLCSLVRFASFCNPVKSQHLLFLPFYHKQTHFLFIFCYFSHLSQLDTCASRYSND